MLRQTSDQFDSYAAIAEYYDLEHDQFQDDIPMYRHVVEMVGDPVVEFACGSGRILQGIAGDGRRLTGLDSSPVMLERCRSRFADQTDPPQLLEQDMASVALAEGHFGVAIIGLNSFMHATSAQEQLATLASAHRALDPRGLLVIDVLNPLVAIHDTGDARVRLERTMVTKSGSTVTKFSSQEIDLAEQIIDTSIWYDEIDSTGSVIRSATTTSLRFVFRSELELMLRAAGFPESHLYGSYELDPYTAGASRLIAFAERS